MGMTRIGRRLRRARDAGDEGFTVAEVLVAFMVFMILAGTAGVALTASSRTSRNNEARVVAANLAQREIETIRGLDATTITNGTTNKTVTIDGRKYYVEQRTTLDTAGGTGSACSGASGPAAYKRVRLLVTWDGMDAVSAVRSDTLRALPVTGLSNGTGVLSVPVQDRSGTGVAGLTIVLSGGRTAVTAEDGCAVFEDVTPSTSYTVSVTGTGYVDQDGNATESVSPVVVTAGEVTKVPAMIYDRSAALAFTVGAPTGYSLPSGLGATLANPGMTTGQKVVLPCLPTVSAGCAAGTSASMTVSNLYPFASGISVWPGTCSTARPAVPASFTMTPGSTTSGAGSPAGAVRALTKRGSTYVSLQTLWAVNEACTTVERFMFTGLTGLNDASALTMALPAGTWRIYSGLAPTAASPNTLVTITSGAVANSGNPVVVNLP